MQFLIDCFHNALSRKVEMSIVGNEINEKDKKSPQHIGLGKKLIADAEIITKKEFGINNISVISGIGVRKYYRKLGYKLKDTYMIKNL